MISIFFGLIVTVAIVLNQILNNLLFSFDQQQLLLTALSGLELQDSKQVQEKPAGNSAAPTSRKFGDNKEVASGDTTGGASKDIPAEEKTSGQANQDNGQEVKPAGNAEIIASIQERVDRPIEPIDLLKVGKIFLFKLSPQEIRMLSELPNKDIGQDELKDTREILLNKLSEEDIATLRELGKKYGKSLRVLDPDVPIQ